MASNTDGAIIHFAGFGFDCGYSFKVRSGVLYSTSVQGDVAPFFCPEMGFE